MHQKTARRAAERDEHLARWIELTESKQKVLRQLDAKPQGGRPEGGIRAAAIKARQVDEPLKGGRQPNEKGQAKAARRLEWDEIDCIFVNADEIECQLREIAENLHRAELTALERDEHVAKWVELTEARQSAQFAPIETKRPDGKGHRKEGGINAAARELGVERTATQRAVKVASLSDEAKQVARDTGLDDNRSVLLAAARQPDDVTYLRTEHAWQTGMDYGPTVRWEREGRAAASIF